MGTNVAIAVLVAGMIRLVGLGPFLLVHLPIMVLAASIGVWLFYVQHQFENTSWSRDEAWSFHEAALYGSSHYHLPWVLRWFTANIGVHHVHHLCSLIPCYRLRDVLPDHPELANVGRITLVQSLRCVPKALWDEKERRLISFRDAEIGLVARHKGTQNNGSVAGPGIRRPPKGDNAAPMNAPAAKGVEKATPGAGSKEMAPQHAQGKPDAKTTGDMKADGKSKASESRTPAATKDKNPTAETTSPSGGKAASEMKAESKIKSSDSAATSKDLKTPTAETKPSTSDNKTTGNAATAATATPPAEKRTQISSAMKQEKVEEVANVNFNLSIGTAVPAGVRYYPMPAPIVEIYPEWRGYDFILVHGRYIVLRPRTHEIVYIIEG